MRNEEKPKEEKQKMFRRILLIAFALSGMSSLIYEVVWARQLQVVFGCMNSTKVFLKNNGEKASS